MQQQATLDQDILVDQTTAGKLLDIPPATLQKYRRTGENNIPFVKIGRSVKYRTTDLKAYIESHTHNKVVVA